MCPVCRSSALPANVSFLLRNESQYDYACRWVISAEQVRSIVEPQLIPYLENLPRWRRFHRAPMKAVRGFARFFLSRVSTSCGIDEAASQLLSELGIPEKIASNDTLRVSLSTHVRNSTAQLVLDEEGVSNFVLDVCAHVCQEVPNTLRLIDRWPTKTKARIAVCLLCAAVICEKHSFGPGSPVQKEDVRVIIGSLFRGKPDLMDVRQYLLWLRILDERSLSFENPSTQLYMNFERLQQIYDMQRNAP